MSPTVQAKARPFQQRERICVSHYPPPSQPVAPGTISDVLGLQSDAMPRNPLAMYIHIPFCDRICTFCPFNKQIMREQRLANYLEALFQEIEIYGRSAFIQRAEFGSLAIGGGTPSCLSAAQIEALMNHCRRHFRFTEGVEVTMEGNPSNFDLEKLKVAFAAGVNRVSFGVQSFNDEFGAMLEIPQTADKSREAIANARKAGFDNVGIDLIYNLPGQTPAQWQADVDEAIALEVDHITLFSLIVPPMTKLFKQIDKQMLPSPNGIGYESQLYLQAAGSLRAAGYRQYSVYDFAKPGKVNLHAQLYFSQWRDLLGLGTAAFGYLNGFMYVNKGDLAAYQDTVTSGTLPVWVGTKADDGEAMCGAMAKGLRLLEVDKRAFEARFGRAPAQVFGEKITSLMDKGLLADTGDRLSLTEEGIFWGNNICREFFSPQGLANEKLPREILARGKAPTTHKPFRAEPSQQRPNN